jgi:spore coat protein U-like protein
MRNSIGTLGALLGLAVATTAAADTATFDVTAEVQETCAITAADLDFGTYIPGGGDVPGSTTLEVLCTTGTAFSVELDGGENGSINDRAMENGGDLLLYNLYTTATFDDVWGDSGTGSTLSDTGTGLAAGEEKAFTVYGLLEDNAANQNAPAGLYIDTVTATVIF